MFHVKVLHLFLEEGLERIILMRLDDKPVVLCVRYPELGMRRRSEGGGWSMALHLITTETGIITSLVILYLLY